MSGEAWEEEQEPEKPRLGHLGLVVSCSVQGPPKPQRDNCLLSPLYPTQALSERVFVGGGAVGWGRIGGGDQASSLSDKQSCVKSQ